MAQQQMEGLQVQKRKHRRLSKFERIKVIHMRNNMMRIPKKFLEYLNWNITGELEVELAQNGIMIKRQLVRCAFCNERTEEIGVNKLPLADNGQEVYICTNCQANLTTHFSQIEEKKNSY